MCLLFLPYLILFYLFNPKFNPNNYDGPGGNRYPPSLIFDLVHHPAKQSHLTPSTPTRLEKVARLARPPPRPLISHSVRKKQLASLSGRLLQIHIQYYSTITPENMTLEETKEQLALYNRFYYQKRRHDKD
jgi:hypothetical protein